MDFIELFAGIGGFRYGLEESNRQQQENSTLGRCEISKSAKSQQSDKFPQRRNYACVWSNELDRYASAIYRYHWNDNALFEGDIRTVNPESIPDHDLIVGGFPCQSFSIAGKRGGLSDTRGTLFAEICRIARAKRTSYLFLENVKGLLSAPYTESVEEWKQEDFDAYGEPTATSLKKHKAISGTKGWVFLTILYTLWELGYDCQWQVLNSKDYGVPQNRERVFIIGHLRNQSRPKVFPIGEDVKLGRPTQQENRQTVPCLESTSYKGVSSERFYGIDNSLIFLGGITDEKNHKWLENSKEDSRNFHQGMRVYSPNGISAQLNAQGGGLGAKTGLYEIPAIAQSLQTDGQLRQGTSWNTNKPQSARNIRRLTPLECERLQGFPDGWTQKGITAAGQEVQISDSQRYKCCGNAVTTNVITEIGKAFMRSL